MWSDKVWNAVIGIFLVCGMVILITITIMFAVLAYREIF